MKVTHRMCTDFFLPESDGHAAVYDRSNLIVTTTEYTTDVELFLLDILLTTPPLLASSYLTPFDLQISLVRFLVVPVTCCTHFGIVLPNDITSVQSFLFLVNLAFFRPYCLSPS